MISNADFVSRVVNDGRFLTKDEYISKRHILKIGRQKVITFISQKLLDRTLYREENLFKYVDCVEMEKVDVVNCPLIEFKTCKKLYRSKKRIEGLIYSRYGSSLVSVTSLDNSVTYDPATSSSANNRAKRMFGSSVNVYYIRDGYLYIPDEIETLNIVLISLNDKETEELSSCNNCDVCKSVWDYNFICPDKLLEPVIMQATQEIVGVYKNHVVDENPNMNSNEKSKISQ